MGTYDIKLSFKVRSIHSSVTYDHTKKTNNKLDAAASWLKAVVKKVNGSLCKKINKIIDDSCSRLK